MEFGLGSGVFCEIGMPRLRIPMVSKKGKYLQQKSKVSGPTLLHALSDENVVKFNIPGLFDLVVSVSAHQRDPCTINNALFKFKQHWSLHDIVASINRHSTRRLFERADSFGWSD